VRRTDPPYEGLSFPTEVKQENSALSLSIHMPLSFEVENRGSRGTC